MFKKILIANRGEIALRIIRACREMGIKTVAVYSEADEASLHLELPDEKHLIGPALSRKSYLNIETILEAARQSGADAVHPGYGYLAERAEFAKACQAANLIFIGPTPENLKLAGDKITAKRLVKEAGVPVIPSSPGGITTLEAARSFSAEIGFPVMLKASGGGGGRGIRICRDNMELGEEFSIAQMEAGAAFGNNELYIEKYLENPRHIEFQVLADHTGNTIHLGERECTIQRRYQKLIEESPSPVLTEDKRQEMGQAAIAAAQAVRYRNAGTVEFLLDSLGQFYFIELNARIQVEHPVTELTTGIDLVKAQLHLASGLPLSVCVPATTRRGWAIECRINAEDPDNDFLPSPGKVEIYRPPGGFGVRLDTHLYSGYQLPIYYDSLLAKLIAYDLTRAGAIAIMERALSEFIIAPLKTTIPLHQKIMGDPNFQDGDFHTGYIKKFIPEDDEEEEEDEE